MKFCLKMRLAKNKFLNKKIQKILANHEHAVIRNILAQNKHLYKETYMILVNHCQYSVSYYLAANKSVPSDIRLMAATPRRHWRK